MFEVYTMYVFEQPFIVKLHCEERRCPMLCISDKAPPFVMMSLDEAIPYLTEEELGNFKNVKSSDKPGCIAGSKLSLRYYLALLCDHYGCPFAVRIKAPDVFICVAMSVKEYNRRVSADDVITEEDIAQAMKEFDEEEA